MSLLMTSVAGLYTQVGMNEIMINFVEEREFSLIFVCISNGILFFIWLINPQLQSQLCVVHFYKFYTCQIRILIYWSTALMVKINDICPSAT